MSNLKQYLSDTGTSQAALAKGVGASRSYISEIVSNLKSPGLVMAVRIERFTGGAVPASAWVPDDEYGVDSDCSQGVNNHPDTPPVNSQAAR
jgi:transcriptional regulator with XRE-family HTH domain